MAFYKGLGLLQREVSLMRVKTTLTMCIRIFMSQNDDCAFIKCIFESSLEFIAYYVYVLFPSTTLLREIKQRQNRNMEEKEEKEEDNEV